MPHAHIAGIWSRVDRQPMRTLPTLSHKTMSFLQTAFPISNQTSPSIMFCFYQDSQDLRCLALWNGSQAATEFTYAYLSLVAKANYLFLRQAIKDQAQFHAGSG